MPEVSALLDAEVPWVELSARLPHAPWGGPLGGALLGHRPPQGRRLPGGVGVCPGRKPNPLASVGVSGPP